MTVAPQLAVGVPTNVADEEYVLPKHLTSKATGRGPLHPAHPPVADLLAGRSSRTSSWSTSSASGMSTTAGRGAGRTTGATGAAGTSTSSCAAAASARA
ncbi:hypothetical protein [Streptomyces sp. NPDC048445]|uniref:hypothetical protein n=1 Tax=Streptomyces sp. NPDC048445 TaxID=3365553 RepID=UPI0037163791